MTVFSTCVGNFLAIQLQPGLSSISSYGRVCTIPERYVEFRNSCPENGQHQNFTLDHQRPRQWTHLYHLVSKPRSNLDVDRSGNKIFSRIANKANETALQSLFQKKRSSKSLALWYNLKLGCSILIETQIQLHKYLYEYIDISSRL